MIVLTRGLARSFRAAAKKCLNGRPRGPAPPVVCQARGGTLTLWSKLADAELLHAAPTPGKDARLIVPMAVFEAAEVTAAPVYDAALLLADEHLRARGTFVSVDDEDFGPTTVHAPVVQLSDTPGRIEHLGRALGADNDAVLGGLLGVDLERLDHLRAEHVI